MGVSLSRTWRDLLSLPHSSPYRNGVFLTCAAKLYKYMDDLSVHDYGTETTTSSYVLSWRATRQAGIERALQRQQWCRYVKMPGGAMEMSRLVDDA